MIVKECKRLAEVDFPIAEVSRHAAREKSIRHGHPSTLHLWWARRPLASSRAVLMALLLPDPCDEHCPGAFKNKARRLLSQVANCDPGTTDATLRKALLRFIADFANWDLAANRTYLEVSRALVKAAHGEEAPLVVDPFAGGGSIPLEALRHRVERPYKEPPRVEFEVFEPKADEEVPGGTVTRAKATCACCGAVLPPERVRAQLAAQKGGADAVFDEKGRRTGGARMTAVVTLHPGRTGRHYRLPTDADYEAVRRAQGRLADILDEWERKGKPGLCPVPNEPLPPIGTLGFRVQRYGMLQWGDLFTARQKVALGHINLLVEPPVRKNSSHEPIAMIVGRCADYGSSGVIWAQEGEFVAHTFGRQALPIVWDFAEAVPWTNSSGNLEGAIDWVARVVEAWPGSSTGQVQSADATDHPLPDQAASIWFTDPPYYDAIPYSDLSDFFLVWIKRTLPDLAMLRDPFDPDNPLSPKTAEAVQDETKQADGRPKDRAWFEETMAAAFAEGRRVLHEDGVGSVVFAHKTTEGWEALLSGMIRGGWTITGSWPIATERPGRLRSQDSAALATSVHLICRPRPEDAPVGDWANVLRELPRRVGDWMERLQGEGVRGADLVFACIGPVLEIFSRYRAIETAEGHKVGLPEYLEKVWEVVGRAALEQVLGTAEAQARNGLAGALEEDARLTALFLWTLQSTETSGENGKKEEEGEEAIAQGRGQGLQPPLRRGALLRPTHGHRPRRLDWPRHRPGKGRGAPAAGGRAGQGTLRRRWCRHCR